jgi:hypothetical protein
MKQDHRLFLSHAWEETHFSQSAGYGILLFDLTYWHSVAFHESISEM